MQVGSDVKVKSLSGKFAKYLTRPGREGTLIKIDGENGLVRFPQSIKRERLYYRHDHWFKLKDLREIHHRPRKKKRKKRSRR